jgi:hypothetical protein
LKKPTLKKNEPSKIDLSKQTPESFDSAYIFSDLDLLDDEIIIDLDSPQRTDKRARFLNYGAINDTDLNLNL